MKKLDEIPNENKQLQWVKEKEVVDRITDALGLEIDEGIKDCVIALRLLGINTSGSHEGKIERYPIPYVDIQSEEVEKLMAERDELIEKLKSPEYKEVDRRIGLLYAKLQTFEDDHDPEIQKTWEEIKKVGLEYQQFEFPDNEELDKLTDRIRKENSKEREKLLFLLSKFYEHRKVDDEVKLIVDSLLLGHSRLKSGGAEVQENEKDENIIKERLKKFQDEMVEFTEFLKGEFYRNR